MGEVCHRQVYVSERKIRLQYHEKTGGWVFGFVGPKGEILPLAAVKDQADDPGKIKGNWKEFDKKTKREINTKGTISQVDIKYKPDEITEVESEPNKKGQYQ